MNFFSIKSRYLQSVLLLFLLAIIPIGLLSYALISSRQNDGFDKLQKQLNLLLVAAYHESAGIENDSLDLQEQWQSLKHLDSTNNFEDLPLPAIERLVVQINASKNEGNTQLQVDISQYPAIYNDTLIVDLQLQSWLDQQLASQLLQDDGQPIENNYAALANLINSFLQNKQNPQQATIPNLWLYITIGFLFYLMLIGYFAFQFLKNINHYSNRFNTMLLSLAEGNIPSKEEEGIRELESSYENINKLAEQFDKIKQFALQASDGTFEQKNIFENKGDLGESLAKMVDNLQEIARNEEFRRWANEGIASFAAILRKHSDDLRELTHEILVHLIKYIDACQGAIFVVNKEEDEQEYLELTACYAYERKKYIEKRLEPGQSLVGQCYLEKKTTYMKEVPQNYVKITSGMGGANPNNILIVPLISNENIYGVLELASFKEMTQHQIDFVERNAESIASAISAVKLNENTKKLLQESQVATEQLRAQEEEMRQNMEELAATQEEMKRRQDELLNNESKTKLIYENAFDAIIIADMNGTIDLFNPACSKIFGYGAEEVKGQNVRILIPEEVSQKQDEILYQQGLSGQVRIITGKRRDGDLFPMRIKLKEAIVDGQKLFILFLEDLSEEYRLRQNLEDQNLLLEKNKNNLLGLINNSEDAIFAIDNKYRIQVVNEKLKSKYADKNLKEGQNILEILPGDQMRIWRERYDKALAGEKLKFFENKQLPDGNEQLLEVFVNPIWDGNAGVKGVSVTSRDITGYQMQGDKIQQQMSSIQELVKKLEKEKADLQDKLKEASENHSSGNELDQSLIKSQINNHEFMLQKLNSNKEKLKAAIQDEKYIMKKSADN
jgi:PAS domain S-box-containing protein